MFGQASTFLGISRADAVGPQLRAATESFSLAHRSFLKAVECWESLNEHLLCKNDIANFIVAQDRARDVARAKAAGFSIGWIADVVSDKDSDSSPDSLR